MSVVIKKLDLGSTKRHAIAPYVGADRVSISWVQVGEIDDVIASVVERMKVLRAGPGKHFAGLSIEWDGETSHTFNCRIQIDDTNQVDA